MKTKLVIYTEKKLSNTNQAQIKFALNDSTLLEISLADNTLKQFIAQYSLVRKDKFDWHINKNTFKCLLLESKNEFQSALFQNAELQLNWLPFPMAIKKLTDGKDKNFLQLAVQFISSGGVDDSVIAADYNEEFIKELLKKFEK